MGFLLNCHISPTLLLLLLSLRVLAALGVDLGRDLDLERLLLLLEAEAALLARPLSLVVAIPAQPYRKDNFTPFSLTQPLNNSLFQIHYIDQVSSR